MSLKSIPDVVSMFINVYKQERGSIKRKKEKQPSTTFLDAGVLGGFHVFFNIAEL